jgi:hypothetical protein
MMWIALADFYPESKQFYVNASQKVVCQILSGQKFHPIKISYQAGGRQKLVY